MLVRFSKKRLSGVSGPGQKINWNFCRLCLELNVYLKQQIP